MEELLVFAILFCAGYEVESEYQNRLDEMFLENPTDEDLLELEFLSSNIKESIIYIKTHVDYNNFNHDIFGKNLMHRLKVCYENTELGWFAKRTYTIWEELPGNIQDEEPFLILSYADEPLCWGDEKQTRELYEHMLNYYNS